MRRNAVTAAGLLVLMLVPFTFGCQVKNMVSEGGGLLPKEQVGFSFDQEKDRISYSLGFDMGRDFQRQNIGVHTDAFAQGVKDGLAGTTPLLTELEMEQVRRDFLGEQQAILARTLGPQAEKTLADGEAFLHENSKKEGVITLPNGLQYKVLSPGEGASPGPKQNVKAHYVVRSIDGVELDNSYKLEGPAVFPVDGVIPAWTVALQMMKEGEKWELYSPAYLAYGEKGVGKVVVPFQTLVFEMELIGIH